MIESLITAVLSDYIAVMRGTITRPFLNMVTVKIFPVKFKKLHGNYVKVRLYT